MENLAPSTCSQTWLIGRRDLGDLRATGSHLSHSVPCALDAPSPKDLHRPPLATLSQSRPLLPFTPKATFHNQITKAGCPVVGGYAEETGATPLEVRPWPLFVRSGISQYS